MIFIDNIKRHFKVDSLRLLANRIGYKQSIVLNWSSGRSSPSLKQLDEVAYQIGVEVSELLTKDNVFTPKTPIWRDKIDVTLVRNLSRLRLEKDIHESFFNEYINKEQKMTYRAFLRYVNGKNKRVNLVALDRLAKIFNISTKELLESEKKSEEKNPYDINF